jgi:hypothetical protein
MRNLDAMGGLAVAPAQVHTALDNWYTVQLHLNRRMKRGYQSNGGRDGRRLGNTGAQNRSNRGDRQDTADNSDWQTCTSILIQGYASTYQ